MWGWLQNLFSKFQPSPLQRMERRVKNPDPEVRREAAENLASEEDPEVSRILISLLNDPYESVKSASRNSLIRQGTNATDALIEGLKHGSDEVSCTCADLLGEFRVAQAVDPLLRVLKFGTRPIQLASKKALIQIGSAAVPALEAVLDESQPWVQQQIQDALTQIQEKTQS